MLSVTIARVSELDPEGEYPLSPYRREKLRRQKNDLARKQGLGVELLLIKALEAAAPGISLPLNISCGKDGKPEIFDSGISFNLSHSGSFAACAVSDSPVGLDIQTERDYNARLAEKHFSAQERRYIEGSENKAYAFTKLWSMKESVVKILGTGLKRPLSSFTVDPERNTACLDGRMLYFHHSLIYGCHLALCSADISAISNLKIKNVKLLP